MFDDFMKLIIGDMDEKRSYKKMMKRIDSLPEDYRFALRKIQKYIYTTGIGINCDFADLIDLFEISAAEGKEILDVIGDDVAAFVHELENASSTTKETLRDKLNREIMEEFNKEER